MKKKEFKTNQLDHAVSLYQEKDMKHWDLLVNLIEEHDISLSEILINYPAFIRRRDLPRMLADYELFKQIINLPGIIVELGVHMGSGLFNWANLMETFCPGDRARKVYGFDNCAGYPNYHPKDGKPGPWVDGIIGKKEISPRFLNSMVDLKNKDNFIQSSDRCKVIIGEIEKTLPKFVAETQGQRISLLYFDVNLYNPTLAGLRELYPLVVPNGIVAFNGFGCRPWQGEALAIDEYFQEINKPVPTLQKFPFSIHPNGYFKKTTN